MVVLSGKGEEVSIELAGSESTLLLEYHDCDHPRASASFPAPATTLNPSSASILMTSQAPSASAPKPCFKL